LNLLTTKGYRSVRRKKRESRGTSGLIGYSGGKRDKFADRSRQMLRNEEVDLKQNRVGEKLG